MFDRPGPQIFGLPCGVDFPAQLVHGLMKRMAGRPPEDLARVEVYVNTARMRSRVTEAFQAMGPCLMPRLRLVTDLSADPTIDLPLAVPPLRRQLELARLVTALLRAEPDLAPRSAAFDLAESLSRLLDEMQGEKVPAESLAQLDLSNHSAHWMRVQKFLAIIAPMFLNPAAPDAEGRQRLAVEQMIGLWTETPPDHPVIIAGSTGSRGTTLRLMEAVARLPQGALVLPGFDFDLPAAVWDRMDDALTAEDHPQFRFRRLLDRLDLRPADVARWTTAAPPSAERNRLVSLALRPAPVTDQWLHDGPALPDLVKATEGVSLITAPSPRKEAQAIALALRDAAERGVSAALVTPDRNLSRQVTLALDRWGVIPDDSAGKPLALSPPGRFLRQVAELFVERITADRFLALLKHPLAFSGGSRGIHLRLTRELELSLRRNGPVFPTRESLSAWAATRPEPEAMAWAQALGPALAGPVAGLHGPGVWLQDHLARAEALARGLAPEGSGGLWLAAAGEAARQLVDELAAEAGHGGPIEAQEYTSLISGLLARGMVREPVQSHPAVMIWGTLEARVQGASLVILGGLNDGIWPRLPDPDPWLNRRMRKEAGILLPERQIGLSAHDFQQAIAAPEVILSRAARDAEAETVPSRWLNRLGNLMRGLPDRNGPDALSAMTERGNRWLVLADALDEPTAAMRQDPGLKPARRPAPQPPVAARPRQLSLTRIETLIRDPYAIYARHILRLQPLDPLLPLPEPRDRGTLYHDILRRFVETRPAVETVDQARQRLMQIAGDVITAEMPYAVTRAMWLARLDRAADFFVEQDRKHGGTALAVETGGRLVVDGLDFTLTGTPDRIDRLPEGGLHLIDYKTGSPPTKDQQRQFAKQLLLAAVMAERGAFAGIDPQEVARISYVGLGAGQKAETTTRDGFDLTREWNGLKRLLGRYLRRETGYAARRALFETRFEGDYDQLSRFGEWEMSMHAEPEPVGEKDSA